LYHAIIHLYMNLPLQYNQCLELELSPIIDTGAKIFLVLWYCQVFCINGPLWWQSCGIWKCIFMHLCNQCMDATSFLSLVVCIWIQLIYLTIFLTIFFFGSCYFVVSLIFSLQLHSVPVDYGS